MGLAPPPDCLSAADGPTAIVYPNYQLDVTLANTVVSAPTLMSNHQSKSVKDIKVWKRQTSKV